MPILRSIYYGYIYVIIKELKALWVCKIITPQSVVQKCCRMYCQNNKIPTRYRQDMFDMISIVKSVKMIFIDAVSLNPALIIIWGIKNNCRWLDQGKSLFYLYICQVDNTLRVRAFFHKTVWVCHVYCNFKIGFTCRITVIFGTLKDGSLLINSLASNICFSYRNMFQNGVDALPKIVDAFLSKRSKFHLVRIIR